jgi:hypothetical protein
MNNKTDSFYIGWQPEAPDSFTGMIRLFILGTLTVATLVCVLIVLNQQGFATSTFEFGEPTEIVGVMTKSPAPFVQIFRGKDLGGESHFQHILLVAPGKHGVRELLQSREAELGHSLEGKMVSVKGYLIYHDGKTLMEVEEMDDVTEQGTPTTSPGLPSRQGQATLIGEITDPKCLFGVMKPGSNKPHRSCAARCIAGGIPPVLKTVSADGYVSYYILTGEDGKSINTEVLPYVGDQVILCGEIRKMGEWAILYKESAKKIALLSDDAVADLAMCR